MHYTRPTKFRVIISCAILISLLSIGLSACTAPIDSNRVADGKPALTNVPQETSQAFRFGVPVESESHALIAAQAGLRTAFKYIKPLTVVKVEQMSYGEYSQQVGQSINRPADMQVWLVIYFNDEWQSIPPRPDVTPSPPFRGCVTVSINADDGSPLEIGGPLQMSRITECDQ
jgi:hypothetical protein